MTAIAFSPVLSILGLGMAFAMYRYVMALVIAPLLR